MAVHDRHSANFQHWNSACDSAVHKQSQRDQLRLDESSRNEKKEETRILQRSYDDVPWVCDAMHDPFCFR